jgi:hypothetical protein
VAFRRVVLQDAPQLTASFALFELLTTGSAKRLILTNPCEPLSFPRSATPFSPSFLSASADASALHFFASKNVSSVSCSLPALRLGDGVGRLLVSSKALFPLRLENVP